MLHQGASQFFLQLKLLAVLHLNVKKVKLINYINILDIKTEKDSYRVFFSIMRYKYGNHRVISSRIMFWEFY